jgi:hypothetical protein
VIDKTFKGRKIYGYKGPQVVPARPCGKNRFNENTALGNGEGKEKKSGECTEVEQGLKPKLV